MSKKIVAKIVSLANALDNAGHHTEADVLTRVAASVANVKVAESDEWNTEDYGICPDCGEYLNEDGTCFDCGYGEDHEDHEDDYDMGPEKEPFDYSSPEDEGDMYGDDREGYMDRDSDF